MFHNYSLGETNICWLFKANCVLETEVFADISAIIQDIVAQSLNKGDLEKLKEIKKRAGSDPT